MKTKKRFSQHFLVSQRILEKLATLVDGREKTLLEIGAGDGRLSEKVLANKPKKLYLVEIDGELTKLLREKFAQEENVKIIEGDFLEISPFPVEIIYGNIPYNITTPIIFRLLDWKFEKAILTVQKEVAERMVAKPGESNYGRLSVTSQICFEVKKAFDIPPWAFYPKPAVYSSAIILKKKRKLTEWEELVIRELFSHKNKRVKNALKKLNAIIPEEIAEKRPRHLSIEEILSIKPKP